MATATVFRSELLSILLEGEQNQVERLTLTNAHGRVSAAVEQVGRQLPEIADATPLRWNFGSEEFSFAVPATTIELSDATRRLTASWDQLRVTFAGSVMTLQFWRLRLTSPRLPDVPLIGDATLTFTSMSSGIQVSSAGVHLYEPHQATGRLSFSGDEIGLQWDGDSERSILLPGLRVTVPPASFELLLKQNDLSLKLNVQAGQVVRAMSAFAWVRGTERELFREEATNALPPDVLTFTSTASAPASLSLVKLSMADNSLPFFFQELGSSWAGELRIDQFVLPILQRTDQSLTVKPATLPRLPGGQIEGKLNLDIKAGELQFQTRTQNNVVFLLEQFAFSINHSTGVPLDAIAALEPQNAIGLSWAFATSAGSPLFRLVTENSNYQLALAAGASATLEYGQLSRDPVKFLTTNFRLAQNGIALTADVLDQPVKLNGINTRFRFHNTVLEVVESTVRDFTLQGSGPLPPALIGDATANISLQFRQNGDMLTLVASAAQLKGTQPLISKTMRFRFPIDSLGLKFVSDGGYHLYFTLSGNALYSPEPGDDAEGPLALLSLVKIPLPECPLAGDCRVLSKHLDFVAELPIVVHFEFLGAFTFELKGFGFLPCVEEFDDGPALKMSGQILFSKDSDTKVVDIEFHELLLGLPLPGQFVPRLFLRELAVEIKLGEAFRLSGSVEFLNTRTESGFKGDGVLEIKGMPQIAASFGFVRVRQDDASPWQRAWFIFLEVQKVSFAIPQIQLYLREVGLGFGYRFTLAAIKGADEENDLNKLVETLGELSKSAGNLSKKEQWVTDLEDAGEDPRWTIVFRALFSQTSASKSPLKYEEEQEKNLPCIYLFDAVVAFRSDLTFFMNARGWINTNYNDFLEDEDDLTSKPIVSGFILLAVRKKRFLAHVRSNPDGLIGDHPPLPDFVKAAIKGVQFSATLLIEPGLFHFELGWPNQLVWNRSFGPLEVEFRGGFIFRVIETATEAFMVIGISFQARAHLAVEVGFDAFFFGASLSATIDAALGARMTAVTSLLRTDEVAVYAAVSLEVRIAVEIVLWVGLSSSLRKEWPFSLSIGLTAGLEFGLINENIGLRGEGTASVTLMGYELSFHASFESDSGNVTEALNITKRFLRLGLEATEVDKQPAIQPAPVAPGVPVAPPAGPGAPPVVVPVAPPDPAIAAAITRETTRLPAVAPNYTIFVKRADAASVYFVLMPAGDTETGFLPGPPSASGEDDFSVTFPTLPANTVLERVKSDIPALTSTSTPDDHFAVLDSPGEVKWNANWDKAVATQSDAQGGTSDFLLRNYLTLAFLEGGTDPVPIRTAGAMSDKRVQNPTDSSFEAAVRGAFEQFRGSPFFKSDPDNEYDAALNNAFHPATTVYSPDGQIPSDPVLLDKINKRQAALHARGFIIQDCVGAFAGYVDSIRQNLPVRDIRRALPFQMGLVFRLRASSGTLPELPDWLQRPAAALAPERQVKIRQRTGFSTGLTTTPATASTFNIAAASFAVFSPKFEHVRQYTSSNTIAIAWDLQWDVPPADTSGSQQDPEHYLMQYQVRRRALDGGEPEEFYTVKSADVLHVEAGVRRRLRPRFQVVDHFNNETLEDQAALPASGRRYLYTITPCDVAGNLGRPLTVLATRFPDQPPLVPAGAELTVAYKLQEADLRLDETHPPAAPEALPLASVHVTWVEPTRFSGAVVPIAEYRLIFRRERTVPVGSYGLDSSTQGSAAKSLPASNARALPTDIRIKLDPHGSADARSALVDLQGAGVFPPGGMWRPEAWTVFFQTESANGVPSSLAPVNLILRFEGTQEEEVEQRRPSELEFIPRPVRLPLLPPEDQQAEAGPSCVPMPQGNFRFNSLLSNIEYNQDPAGLRCIRFLWNQGPGGEPAYPLDLNAGYRFLELDIDAQTTETFTDRSKLAGALRQIQEAQMAPGEDLLLIPNDTLSTSLWKAWYPSTITRQRTPEQKKKGSETPLRPWFSWRESTLDWPEWPGFTQDNPTGSKARPQAFHPALRDIVDGLKATFNVQVQVSPPAQQTDLAGFMRSTAPSCDPYGWSILQRMGLSITISLHDKVNGHLVSGEKMLAALSGMLSRDALRPFLPYLHVELLFQPGEAIKLRPGTEAAANALLGFVQLSLRPAFRQVLSYGKADLTGTPGQAVTVTFSQVTEPCTFIDLTNLQDGEIDIKSGATRIFHLPSTGKTTLLLRFAGNAPKLTDSSRSPDVEIEILINPFTPDDEESGLFTVPQDFLAQQISASADTTGLANQWRIFRRLAEALNANPNDTTPTQEPRITIPSNLDGVRAILPEYVRWTSRFFEHSAAPVLTQADGPWVATAYPESGTPSYVTPDAAGRLTWNHIVVDPWAHNYRYYIQPFGRYDQLWQSLRQSRTIFPSLSVAERSLPATSPDPTQPALDVVLDRIKPVAMPVVIRSRRLDPEAGPGSPAEPGQTWEVIVAQHPEQALMERNQTVFRQLSYRGIAFTLLRQFLFGEWADNLDGLSQAMLMDVTHPNPAIPRSYPDQPDHLPLTLNPADRRATDIQQRIGVFGQGATVLQWEGLPFYYKHQLMLIAQTDSTVSPVNSLSQTEFEYVSPVPEARFSATDTSWQLKAPFVPQTLNLRLFLIEIALQRLWDSLPTVSRQRWPEEEPTASDSGPKPGGVPDPEVIYQIVDRFAGNVEVQSEYFVNDGGSGYSVRQVGKRYQAQLSTAPNPAARAAVAEKFQLLTPLLPVAEVKLSRVFSAAGQANVAIQDSTVLIAGVPQKSLVSALLRANMTITPRGSVARLVSTSPAIPAELAGKVEYPGIPSGDDVPASLGQSLVISRTSIQWTGSMSSRQKTALQQYRSDSSLFQTSVSALLEDLGAAQASVTYHDSRPRTAPPALQNKLRIETMEPPEVDAGWKLTFTGDLTEADAGELRTLVPVGDPIFAQGIETLITQAPQMIAITEAGGNSVTRAVRRVMIPLVDSADLAQRMGVPAIASKLSVSTGRLTWTGFLDVDVRPDDLAARLTAIMPAGDPIVPAFRSLMEAVRGDSFGADQNTAEVEYSVQGIFDGSAATTERSAPNAAVAYRFRLKVPPEGLSSSSTRFDVPNVPVTFTLAGVTTRFTTTVVFSGNVMGLFEPEQINLNLAAPIFSGPTTAPELNTGSFEFDGGFVGQSRFEGTLTVRVAQIRNSRGATGPAPFLEQIQGPRLIAAHSPLNEVEAFLLTSAFNRSADRTNIDALIADLQDKGRLEALPDGCSSETAVSRVVSPLPEALTGVADFLDATSCELVWKGPISTADRAALDTISGDADFLQAIRDLQPAAEGGFRVQHAPLGFDQVPASLRNKIRVDVQGDGRAIGLTALAPLTDDDASVLKAWAQIPALGAAARSLLDGLDSGVVTITLPAEIPANVQGSLQIQESQLAWIGPAPTTAQENTLAPLLADGTAFAAALRTLLDSAGSAPVVTVPGSFHRRPSQADLPALLQRRLTITPNEVRWAGRVENQRQLELLSSLQGDAPFRDAISRIVGSLAGSSVPISPPIDKRPDQAELPSELQGRLLIGKARLRFHGPMSDTEGTELRTLYPAQPDRDALERLHRESLFKGLQGRELLIRSRRGAAQPSPLLSLQARELPVR